MVELYNLINDFLYSMQFSENKKVNTIKSMKKDLEQFFQYISGEINISEMSQIDTAIIRGFLQNLKKNIGERSINRKISTLKSFFRFLMQKKAIKFNMMEEIIPPMYTVENPEIITEEDLEKIRNVIDIKNLNGLRDRTIIEFLYSSGMTSVELLHLGESSVNLDKSELTVYNGKYSRIVFISNTAKKYYCNYINLKKSYFREKYNSKYVFVNNSGSKLSDRSLRRITEKYGKIAKIQKEVSPYIFRHSFAIYMLEHGMNVLQLQKLMGHITIESTLFYKRIIDKKGVLDGKF